MTGDSYEAQKKPGVDVFFQELPNFFNLPSYLYFVNHLKEEFIVPMVLGIVACFSLVAKRKYLMLILFISSFLGYFVLIIITYYKGESPNMYQLYYVMFGLFLVNTNSLIVFFLESVPFILASTYLLKNTKFITKFVSFLITFFIIYTSIWLLGNDNLGTAVRLRIPSYLVIFASMLIVYQTKVVIGYEKTNNSDL